MTSKSGVAVGVADECMEFSDGSTSPTSAGGVMVELRAEAPSNEDIAVRAMQSVRLFEDEGWDGWIGLVSYNEKVALFEAARRFAALLASQATTEGRYVEPAGSSEQTPDITDEMVDAATTELARRLLKRHPTVQLRLYVSDMRAALVAALVGFHPGDKGDET